MQVQNSLILLFCRNFDTRMRLFLLRLQILHATSAQNPKDDGSNTSVDKRRNWQAVQECSKLRIAFYILLQPTGESPIHRTKQETPRAGEEKIISLRGFLHRELELQEEVQEAATTPQKPLSFYQALKRGEKLNLQQV
mgnify:CR=1 FL=1